MNYRFVKITTYYKNFLKYYYSKKPQVVNLSYQEQHDDLMSEAFGWSDYYQTHLNNLGNDAYEIVTNAATLQSAWAREHSTNAKDEELLLEQIKAIKPNVVFFQDSFSFSSSFIKNLKKNIPTVKKIIGWCCSPYTHQQLELFKYFDFAFACSPLFVDILKQKGIEAYRLNHAFEPSLLPRIETANPYPQTDFIFIGSFIGNTDFHNERTRLVESLLNNKINMSLFTNLPSDNPIYILGQKVGYSISGILKSLGLSELAYNLPFIAKTAKLTEMPKALNLSREFKQLANPSPLYGIEMFKALSKSKIGFNSHGGVAGDYAANVRLFEVTGVGSCLLTDHKKNITDFFEPDKEVVTYKSAEECVEKVNWLLSHPDELKNIAAAGQRRTLKYHTFERRAEELNEVILKLL